MSKKVNKEHVSVSFHILKRVERDDSQEEKFVAFTEGDFDELCKALEAYPPLNLKDANQVDQLKNSGKLPLEDTLRVNARTAFGVYRNPYSGHEYENSAKGVIPADSVSLRKFHYLVYLSESGAIYLACQYLGQFGGYYRLSSTIKSLIGGNGRIEASSVRLNSTHFQGAKPKEVHVSYSGRPQSIAARNPFRSGSVVVFKKTEKDDMFEENVNRGLLSLLGRKNSAKKKEIAKLLNESELFEVSDSDIEDCKIIAEVQGKRKTIYMFDNSGFATKFPLEVKLNASGHPKYHETKDAIIRVLKEEIISRKEDV